ncbi:MAG: ABC transporter permease [Candidatus Methanomethylophilaceae archaeon]|nr:type transport system permease protein [Candidatus Methanomethylophilaceae archaeon]
MSARAVYAGFKQQAVQFFADPQWIIPSLVSPFLLTMVMIFLSSGGTSIEGPVVLQAVLGGGVLGMWANSLFSSSSSVSFDRINGTFEPMLGSGTRIIYVLAGRSLWSTLIGLLNAFAVFAIAEVMFGAGMSIHDPILFFLTLLMTMLSLSSVGLLISTLFVLTRKGGTISSVLEYPIYVMSGALVPISMLPGWMQSVSRILAPTWGVDAIKYSALPVYEGMLGTSFFTDTVMCLALSVLFIIVAYFVMLYVERKVLRDGTATRY